ncbi:MAG TPA: efflux RND transporter periplasmic adaptor subunit [Steroidobacteraceae bacterium]|nr:efflux RND transporter periplasmic adaptor subunit [Steroidobacteraceae bacterium]
MNGPRRNLAIAALGLAGLVGAAAWFTRELATAAGPPAVPSGVPVETALVTRATVPVYLEGLGNVQAFYTANITARVDGELQRVAFVEGQMVRKGQLLAQIDPRPNQAALDQAVATEAKDGAQLDSAKSDLERYLMLAPQNLASKQTVDQQRALVAQLQAQLKVDRAIIDNARTQLDYTSIVSPIDGRTGIRKVDPGNNVHASDTTGIVVVTQMQPITIVFTLPEDDLLPVSRALGAGAVQVTALSRDNQTELDTGTLSLIDNQIDPSTATMRLKAVFPNQHSTLWPGQFVNVRLLVQQQQGVMTVPSAAIQHGPDGLFTYVVRSDSTVEARALKAGVDSEGVVVVTDGLKLGERVVINNQYRLQPGARIRVLSAAEPPIASRAAP